MGEVSTSGMVIDLAQSLCKYWKYNIYYTMCFNIVQLVYSHPMLNDENHDRESDCD